LSLIKKKMDNVNKRGWKVRKHIKLLIKILFNQWRDLYGYHVKKSIVIFL
jgi:hypothetical protein